MRWLLAVAIFAAGLGAGDLQAEDAGASYHLSLGPSTIPGVLTELIDPKIPAGLEGIEDCRAELAPEDVVAEGGWVVSFQALPDSPGVDLGWNEGHGLPAALKDCATEQIERLNLAPDDRGVQQVVWIRPTPPDGEDPESDPSGLPWHERAATDKVVAQDWDGLQGCLAADEDPDQPWGAPPSVELWFAVDAEGAVASTAVVSTGSARRETANCVARRVAGLRFEPAGAGWRRTIIERSEAPIGEAGPDSVPEVSSSESRGRALAKPTITYPKVAKINGVEGEVRLKLLVDVDGRPVLRTLSRCAAWHEASAAVRRADFHPRWCMWAVEGPRELVRETVRAWGNVRWKPYVSRGRASQYWVNVITEYRLVD